MHTYVHDLVHARAHARSTNEFHHPPNCPMCPCMPMLLTTSVIQIMFDSFRNLEPPWAILQALNNTILYDPNYLRGHPSTTTSAFLAPISPVRPDEALSSPGISCSTNNTASPKMQCRASRRRMISGSQFHMPPRRT